MKFEAYQLVLRKSPSTIIVLRPKSAILIVLLTESKSKFSGLRSLVIQN